MRRKEEEKKIKCEHMNTGANPENQIIILIPY